MENMKSTVVMVLLLGLLCLVMAENKYPVKYDNVNIETVLSNERVLSNYIKCLLDKGACTREGRELKSECALMNIIRKMQLIKWRNTCVRCRCSFDE